MLLDLSEEFLTGNSTIDTHNLEILARTNKLISALKKGDGESEIDCLISFLESTILGEFAFEEDIQLKGSYDGYRGHREDHQMFIAEFNRIKIRYQSMHECFATAIELMNMIVFWLARHVCVMDKEFIEAAGDAA